VVLRHLLLRHHTFGPTTQRVWHALPNLPLFWLESAVELLAPVHLYFRSLQAEYAGTSVLTIALASLVVLGMAVLGVWLRRRAPLVPWALTWFAVTLAPTVLITTVVGWLGFGRYLYAPAISIAILLAGVFAAFARQLELHGRSALLAWGLASLFLLRQTVLLAFETQDYQNERTLFSDVVREAPDMAHGYAALAITLMNEKDAPTAVAMLRKAIELDPVNIQARLNLIQALKLSHDFRGAEQVARSMLPRMPPQKINSVRVQLVSTIHLDAPEETTKLLMDCLRLPYEQADCRTWIVELTHNHPLRERYRALFAEQAVSLSPSSRAYLEQLTQ
jgi:tetratricopeptide (TPR) repeat protein